jgi:hypothetical protein
MGLTLTVGVDYWLNARIKTSVQPVVRLYKIVMIPFLEKTNDIVLAEGVVIRHALHVETNPR